MRMPLRLVLRAGDLNREFHNSLKCQRCLVAFLAHCLLTQFLLFLYLVSICHSSNLLRSDLDFLR